MSDAFCTLLTADRLRALAGVETFDRGGRLLEAVSAYGRTAYAIVARIDDSLGHDVTLFVEDGVLSARCTCTTGTEPRWCAHAVAVGLVAIRGTPSPPSPQPTGAEATDLDLAVWLRKAPHEELVDLLLDLAETEPPARRRLQLRRSTTGAVGPDLGHFEREIDRATGGSRYIDYRHAPAVSHDIFGVIGELERLLPTRPDFVIPLGERLLGRLQGLVQRMDDSDGHLAELRDATEAIHLRACERVRPDPVALAQRLHRWHMSGELDVLHGAIERYAAVLGPAGRAAYRALAEPLWQALHAPSPDDRDDGYGASRSHRFRVTSSMEALERACGDIDAWVRVIEQDSPTSYGVRRVVEAYASVGRSDAALAAAERGRAAFPGEPHASFLDSWVVDAYQERGRHDDALAIVWADFERRPDVPKFDRLCACAARAGQRPRWVARALDRLRERVEGPPVGGAPNADARSGLRDTWVAALLREGDVEAASTVATAGPCSSFRREEVAELRAATHPLELVPFLRNRVTAEIDARTNSSYARAVDLLVRIRDLLRAGGRGVDFPPYLAGMREAHRAKRNLVTLIDRRNWTAP